MGYLSARGTPFSASAVPIFKIARRKGVSIILGFVIGLFPFAIVSIGIWWAGLSDNALLDRISQLEGRQGP